MELYFLRHGIAEELDGVKYKVDSERPLSSEGRSKMKEIARAIQRMEIEFDQILSSSYVRAQQTAQAVAEELKWKNKISLCEPLIPSASPKDLFREISTRYQNCESVLLVGHEPNISRSISSLLAGHLNLAIQIKKGGSVFIPKFLRVKRMYKGLEVFIAEMFV